MSRFTIESAYDPAHRLDLARLQLYGATPLALIVFGSVWPVRLQAMCVVHQELMGGGL
jgi:hypothetical protein